MRRRGREREKDIQLLFHGLIPVFNYQIVNCNKHPDNIVRKWSQSNPIAMVAVDVDILLSLLLLLFSPLFLVVDVVEVVIFCTQFGRKEK